MNGCISAHTLWMWGLVMLRIWSWVMILGVGAGANPADKADDALLCFDQWLEVGFSRVA